MCLLVPGEVPDAALGGAMPAAETEVAQRLRDLPVNPLGVDRQVRVSLAGMQAKLLVTQTGGGWALPGTTPSTHILKPESPLWASSVDNESFCLEVARQLGLAVTRAEVLQFEDVRVLAVERYDRVVEAGAVARIHQEDFAQSLGLTPGRKYQGTGGASLADCDRVLERWSRVDDRLGLMDMVALSLAVGNADLHAKNLSLLHGPDHSVRLAPVYDLMSTAYYPRASPEAAMAVNGRTGLGDIGWEDLVEEAVSWGLPRRVVTGRMSELVDRLPAAVEAAAGLTNPPGALADFVMANVARLGAGWAAAPAPGRGGGAPSAGAGGGESEEAASVSVRSYRRADGTAVRSHPRRSPGPRKLSRP
ncbi:MAG: HipA domain-containing protein [Acidimicrobiales bacterium]